MSLTLADEFEFIAGDEIYQSIGDRPQQACRTAVSLMNVDPKLLSVVIPSQLPHRAARLKYLIDNRKICCLAVQRGVHHGPGGVTKLTGPLPAARAAFQYCQIIHPPA